MPEIQTKEARIILAIEAICLSKKISMRKATAFYNVSLTTLSHRINGTVAKQESRPAN